MNLNRERLPDCLDPPVGGWPAWPVAAGRVAGAPDSLTPPARPADGWSGARRQQPTPAPDRRLQERGLQQRDGKSFRMASICRTIAITGANGNIGQKLARHLLAGTTTIKGDVSEAQG